MDFFGTERNTAIENWFKSRIAQIREKVSAGDVLTRNGVALKWNGDREEQISCPFHGKDENPSARYFPDEDDSPSHVWCYACHKRWDTIGLWIEFNGKEKFSQTLFQIERAFGLTAPESNIQQAEKDTSNPLKEEVDQLFEVCERRLRGEREHFDMNSHLKLGALVDRLRFAMDNKELGLEDLKGRLTLILTKIGERVRAKTAINNQP